MTETTDMGVEQFEPPKDVLLFGGAFNPLTLGHMAVVDAVLEQIPCDELWLLPSGERTDKPDLLSNIERLGMLREVIENEYANERRVMVSDLEMWLPQPTSTANTLLFLHKLYPETRFRYIVGEDSVADMPKWPGGKELLAEYEWVIVPREGAEITEMPKDYVYVEFEPMDMSSTKVRDAVAAGAPIGDLVCESIERIVTEKRLYK